jgi:type VI secretion system protein ImpF
MAQLSLRERLQPALLDRLIDNERLLITYELTFRREEFRRLGISERELSGILTAQGLRSTDTVERAGSAEDPGLLRMTFVAAAGNVPLSHLKALVLKPEGAPQGVSLQSFCEIVPRSVVNNSMEAGELKSISMRRLREYVCRDLGALLNCASLDAVVDLTAYPHVQASVVNFGMPSLAGRAARSADPLQIAATIEAAIRRFEPRLSAVRVTPEMGEEGNETHVLAFRIEAQLWGQPAPLQLVLRTRIDVDSGSVNVADAGVG